LGLIVHQVAGLLDSRFHAQALLSPDAPTLIASLAPSVAAAANSLRGILLSAAVIATVVLVFRGLRRAGVRALVLTLLAGALLSSDIRTPGEFALQSGMSLMTVAAAFLFCRYFARDNYLGYAVALWTFSLREPLAELYGSPRQPHFWILLAILAAGLLWALVPLSKKHYPEPGP
jgi:hypothetical protein